MRGRASSHFQPRFRKSSRFLRSALLLAGLLAAPVRAQITQQTVPLLRTLPLREELEGQVTSARYRLGPVRLIPAFTLSDTGYNNNINGTETDKVADWTSTVSAGARIIVPAGTHFYVRGIAMPSYIWFAHNVDARQFGGDYGAEVVLFPGKATLRGSGSSTTASTILSSETQAHAIAKDRSADGSLEIPLGGRVALLASGTYATHRYDEIVGIPAEDLGFDQLNRKEDAYRGGVRYSVSKDTLVSVEYEETRAEFDNSLASVADNRSHAYVASIWMSHSKLFVNLNGAYRSYTSTNSSLFPEFSTGTGSGYIDYLISSNLSIGAFGSRGVQYSLSPGAGFYIESYGGGNVSVEIGQRVSLSAQGQTGTNDYSESPSGEVAARRDRINEFLGKLTLEATRRLKVEVFASKTQVRSNFPGESRSLARVGVLVSLELTSGVTIKGAAS